MKKTIGLLFPGQGSQYVGMGREAVEAHPACADLYKRASDVMGVDLAAVSFDGPEEELTRSLVAQPAIFVASMAAMKLVEASGGDVDFCAAAGLSSGEWTALCVGGVVSFEDTVRILRARGTFMQEACDAQPGGMISLLGLDLDAASQVAEKAGLEVANINSPKQIVLSGHKERIPDAEQIGKEAGAKRAVPLNVAGAFHSTLMQPAADKFEAFLADVNFQNPSMPVLSNVTGRVHEDAASIKQRMVEQIVSSVRWVECMQGVIAMRVSACIECGPGNVLAGLAKRIDKGLQVHTIQNNSDAQAWVAGLDQ